jgi:hypothetical protein
MEPPFDSLLAWKGGLVMAWFAVFFGAERLLPAAASPVGGLKEPDGRRRLGRNLGLWLLNVGLSPLFVLPVSLWAVGLQLEWRPLWWSGWQGLVVDVVVLDFLIYWWHLANHRVALFWRFHEVHHLDRTLDTTTAVRFHFGEVALSAMARAARPSAEPESLSQPSARSAAGRNGRISKRSKGRSARPSTPIAMSGRRAVALREPNSESQKLKIVP